MVRGVSHALLSPFHSLSHPTLTACLEDRVGQPLLEAFLGAGTTGNLIVGKEDTENDPDVQKFLRYISKARAPFYYKQSP